MSLVTTEGKQDSLGFVYKYQTGSCKFLVTVSSNLSVATSWIYSSGVLLSTLLPDDTKDTPEQEAQKDKNCLTCKILQTIQ